ncbi:MAG: hypothetical protein WCJ71_11550, partial [Candidatus Omnitrophota bacterium]
LVVQIVVQGALMAIAVGTLNYIFADSDDDRSLFEQIASAAVYTFIAAAAAAVVQVCVKGIGTWQGKDVELFPLAGKEAPGLWESMTQKGAGNLTYNIISQGVMPLFLTSGHDFLQDLWENMGMGRYERDEDGNPLPEGEQNLSETQLALRAAFTSIVSAVAQAVYWLFSPPSYTQNLKTTDAKGNTTWSTKTTTAKFGAREAISYVVTETVAAILAVPIRVWLKKSVEGKGFTDEVVDDVLLPMFTSLPGQLTSMLHAWMTPTLQKTLGEIQLMQAFHEQNGSDQVAGHYIGEKIGEYTVSVDKQGLCAVKEENGVRTSVPVWAAVLLAAGKAKNGQEIRDALSGKSAIKAVAAKTAPPELTESEKFAEERTDLTDTDLQTLTDLLTSSANQSWLNLGEIGLEPAEAARFLEASLEQVHSGGISGVRFESTDDKGRNVTYSVTDAGVEYSIQYNKDIMIVANASTAEFAAQGMEMLLGLADRYFSGGINLKGIVAFGIDLQNLLKDNAGLFGDGVVKVLFGDFTFNDGTKVQNLSLTFTASTCVYEFTAFGKDGAQIDVKGFGALNAEQAMHDVNAIAKLALKYNLSFDEKNMDDLAAFGEALQ